MKKNLFCMWLVCLVILFSANTQAQMTIGGKKEPEKFSALEILNIGGVRMPQMTTVERNAFAVKDNAKGEGLTIYNSDTKCIEYWNAVRWVSLCEGTSQTKISPEPCVNVAADCTGCDQTFTVDDVDCPNGPFNIAIVAGGEYANLTDVDNVNGKFKIDFKPNETVNIHTVLVRVTSTCTSLFKEFLFSQNGMDCNSMSYSVPTISPTTAALTLCTGGAVYLSVPANTANLDKLIWTRNGIEVARGVYYYVATQKGEYNISMGAVGCNTNSSNKRTITESGSVTPVNLTAIASNNGVLCGTNSVTLTASGSTASIVWFHNGKEEKSGSTVTISGDSSVGEWFAATKSGDCYSKPSNSITVSKSEAIGQVSLPAADVLVNGARLDTFTTFCSGGTLDLSVANKTAGITYTWYNGNDVITVNPFTVPSSQAKMSLRLVATDNSGSKCPAEASVIEKDVISGSTPAQPNITSPTNGMICGGSADLTLVPAVPGNYTYTWYKDGVKMSEKTATITVATPGVTYTGTVTNATGCTSTLATKVIPSSVSSLPVLTWVSKLTEATYGAKVTLQTSIEFGPATAYTWTAESGATIVGSGENATIQLPASGADGAPLIVTVFAENSCGKSETISLSIPMKSACPTPVLTAQSALTQNITAGSNAVVSVSASGTVNPTYQWYSSTSSSTNGGAAIDGATTASYSPSIATAGTYYYYCIVTNGCDASKKATSPAFTVIAEVNPAILPVGTGTLSGKTCFDIAESNDGADCGVLASRQLNKADFNTTATNTQTYTFTPSGTVSNVRFKYVESLSGAIVKSLDGGNSGNNISSAVTATLLYKTTLSTGSAGQGTAYGKTFGNALSVDIYVIYNDNASGTGTDRTVKLKAQIKDCACCGAYVAAGVWKEFMCHNLGADESLDPFVFQPGIMGSYYNWGTKTTVTSASSGGFVVGAWGTNGIKSETNDPCPKGYRVPTAAEWSGVVNNNLNPQTPIGNTGYIGTSGIKFGNLLMLPSTGYAGAAPYGSYLASSPVVYYSSELGMSGGQYAPKVLINHGYNGFKTYSVELFNANGISIRCISDAK